MDSFDTCTVVRYWSKFVQSAIGFPLSDLEVKVIYFDSDGILLHNAWYRYWLEVLQNTTPTLKSRSLI